MKILNKILIVPLLALSLVLSMLGPLTASAATTPSLGFAASYAILSSSFINTFAGTVINGSAGFTTGPAVAPQGTHTYYGSGAPYSGAGTDQGSALTNLAAQAPCTFTFAGGAVNLTTDVTHGGTVGTYTPGIYCSSGATSISGTLTLNGAGTYIFRVAGAALSSASSAIVLLSGGASACDVFWTPDQATTLGANTVFQGTDIDPSGITTGANTVWTGRALAFGGTVTTGDTTSITAPPTCSAPLALPPPPLPPNSTAGGNSAFAPLPLINVTKIPNPLALPNGPGSVTYTYTATNLGVVPMYGVWVTDNQCSPVNYVSGDTNSNSLLDLTESWIYQCTKIVPVTTTNTATAHGAANGWDGYDTANATVVVGATTTPPLIHLTKRPSVFVLPVGGGPVTYFYSVTNPGVVPLSDVSITDDRCTGLPGRVTGHPGDLNKNDLLDNNETWQFTCQSNLTQTTTNTATVIGHANGFTAVDYSEATVVVAGPTLPGTGYGSGNKISWSIVVLSVISIGLYYMYLDRKKRVI